MKESLVGISKSLSCQGMNGMFASCKVPRIINDDRISLTIARALNLSAPRPQSVRLRRTDDRRSGMPLIAGRFSGVLALDCGIFYLSWSIRCFSTRRRCRGMLWKTSPKRETSVNDQLWLQPGPSSHLAKLRDCGMAGSNKLIRFTSCIRRVSIKQEGSVVVFIICWHNGWPVTLIKCNYAQYFRSTVRKKSCCVSNSG